MRALCFISFSYQPFMMSADVHELLKTIGDDDKNPVRHIDLLSCYIIYSVSPKKDESEQIAIGRVLKKLLSWGSSVIFALVSTIFESNVAEFQLSLYKALGSEIPLRAENYQYFKQILGSYFGITDLIQTAHQLNSKSYHCEGVIVKVLLLLFKQKSTEHYYFEPDTLISGLFKSYHTIDSSLLELTVQYCELMFQRQNFKPLSLDLVESILFSGKFSNVQIVITAFYVLSSLYLERNFYPNTGICKDLEKIAKDIPLYVILTIAKKFDNVYPGLISLSINLFPTQYDPGILLLASAKSIGQGITKTDGILPRSSLSESNTIWIKTFGTLDFRLLSRQQLKIIKEKWFALFLLNPNGIARATMRSLLEAKCSSADVGIYNDGLVNPSTIVEITSKLLDNEHLISVGLLILKSSFITFQHQVKRQYLPNTDRDLQITNYNCLEALSLLNFLEQNKPNAMALDQILGHIHEIILCNIPVLHKVLEIQYPVSLIPDCIKYIPCLRIQN